MYIKTDEDGVITHVSDTAEDGYQYADCASVHIGLDSIMCRTLYLDNGVVKERPLTIPYYIQRSAEYPQIGDQLDALWKLIKANADKIDLAEAVPLLEAVQDVKDKYPKAP